MKTVTFDEARAAFEQMFQLALAGETVVISRNGQHVALRSLQSTRDPEVAPSGYFTDDYSREDIAELNTFASQAPKLPLP